MQSVGRAKGKGAACVRTSIKRDVQLSKLSNAIGPADYRREVAQVERAKNIEAGKTIRSERQIERMLKRAQRRKAKR